MAGKKLKEWFDIDLAKDLGKKINAVDQRFSSRSFVSKIRPKLDSLELKDRIELFADVFDACFEDYAQGVQSLSKILGPENEEEKGMFTNFYWLMPMAKYVEKYGVEDYDISMQAIEEITKRNTSEYTIRPYLEKYPNKTLKQMKKWSTHKNRHVRRLSSEGVRPRLPWAAKLDLAIEKPTLLIPILENLKDDPSKYVQKSVANCINDILKDNPAVGKKLIKQWNGTNIGKERKWIINHALRNLVKVNDRWALHILESL